VIPQFISQKKSRHYLPVFFHLLAAQKYFENENKTTRQRKISIAFVEKYSQRDISETILRMLSPLNA